MSQKREFEGKIHEFPDDFTEDEIQEALSSFSPMKQESQQQYNNPENLFTPLHSTLSSSLMEQGNKIGQEGPIGKGAMTALSAIPFAMTEGPIASILPFASKSPMIARLISSMLSGGTQSALENPESMGNSAAVGGVTNPVLTGLTSLLSSQNPLLKIGSRSALGAGIGYGLGGTTGAGLGAVGANIAPQLIASNIPALRKLLAKNNMLGGVNEEAIKPKLEAAERLGLEYLTPAEATGLPRMGARQGMIGKTEGAAELLQERSNQRITSEEKAIKDFYTKIFDKDKLDPEVSRLYAEAGQSKLPEEDIAKFKQNKVIQKGIEKVEKNKAYQQEIQDKKIEKDSFVYWDLVKRAIDELGNKAAVKKGANYESTLIGKNMRKLRDRMDEINPTYKEARNLAELEITRGEIEKKMASTEMKGTNFYRKILSNSNNYEDLLHSLRNAPEAQQALKDMKLVFKDLIDPETARAAANLEKTHMKEGRNTTVGVKDFLYKLIDGAYDKEAVELITNPQWHKELELINKEKNNANKAIKMSQLMNKIISAEAGNLANFNKPSYNPQVSESLSNIMNQEKK